MHGGDCFGGVYILTRRAYSYINNKSKKEGNLMSHIKFVLAWVQLGIIFFHSLGWLKFIGAAAGLVFWSPLELFIILWITDAFLYIFLVDKGKHFKD